MALPDTFTAQEVNDAVAELKACIDDAKQNGIFQHLVEKYLPRFSYVLTHNRVLVEMLNELPKADTESLFECMENRYFEEADFSVEPKVRLSQQVTILTLAGNGQLDLWDFVDVFFGVNSGGRFWEEIFNPASRDLMRHVISLQNSFNDRNRSKKNGEKQKMNALKGYALDLFISHSSKDRQLAKNLIEFLRAALTIPADRVRCTSVDGYKLFGGAKTDVQLPKEIQSAKCFIGLITPESLQSQFVLFELGARWGMGEHLVPILGSGVTASELRPPLSNLNALNSANKNEMEQFVHDLAKVLKKSVPLSSTYAKQLSTLLKSKANQKSIIKPATSKESAQQSRLDWHNFKSDKIFSVLWRWNYIGNQINETSLTAFCPQQGCMNRLQIVFDPMNTKGRTRLTFFEPSADTLNCHRCGFKEHLDCDEETFRSKVMDEIERLINTGEYVQRL